MKQKILIVAVVVLSVVLALVIGLAVKLELDAAKSDPAPVTTTDANVPTESTAETTPDETTQPTATVPQDTQPAVTEPEDEYTWPMDDVDTLFAEMQVYAQAEEIPHFAACCGQLSRLVLAMAQAHSPTWWNFL